MQARTTSSPDWRDGSAYAVLRDADRSLMAWEWLRRDPRYRSALDQNAVARRFGLIAFEPAERAVPDARPMWRHHVHPFVLQVERSPGSAGSEQFDPGSAATLALLRAGPRGDHLLLSDGLRAIRLDAPPGTLAGGPVGLRYRLEGLQSAEAPLLTLRRLLALCRSGRFARTLHPPEARARRWIMLLRAADALADVASQQDIAYHLVSRSAIAPGWRSREPSVRTQVQRLVAGARAMGAGGYRRLLLP